LAAGVTVPNVTFGLHFTAPPWQNSDTPTDVNGDGATTIADLLMVLNHLRMNGFGDLTGEPEEGDPHVDVNGDNLADLKDLIEVVTTLRSQLNGGGEGESAAPGFSLAAPTSAIHAPAPEGESSVAPTYPLNTQSLTTHPDRDQPIWPGLSLAPEHGPHECGDEHEHHASVQGVDLTPPEDGSNRSTLDKLLDDIAADVLESRVQSSIFASGIATAS
jgi:hypothetical protein